MGGRKIPGGLLRRLIWVVTEADDRFGLERPVQMINRVPAQNHERVRRVLLLFFKFPQVRRASIRGRKQGQSAAKGAERAIDLMGNQVNFDRLILPHDYQRFPGMIPKILCAFGNPLRIHALGNRNRRTRERRRNRRRHFAHAAGGQTEPMIGAGAGEREQRFHRVEAIHAAVLGLAALGKSGDVAVSIVFGADKIAVERQDDLRLIVVEQRPHRLAEGLGGGALREAGINRIASVPAGPGKFIGDDFLQACPRGRRAAFGEEGEPCALICSEFLREIFKELQRLIARNDLAIAGKMPGAVRIVQVQDGGLGIAVGAAIAAGIERIALHLDRATFVGFGHQRNSAAAGRHGRRVKFRFSVNVIGRLLAKRLQLFLGSAAARTHHAQARQHHGGGHDLDEMAARHGIGQFAGALGELALQPLLELRSVGQFIQTAPVTASGGGRG